MLESAQRGALSLILRTMSFTPTEALEAELSVLPIDLRISELQHHEAGKHLTKEEEYIKANMEEQSHKQKIESPFWLVITSNATNTAYCTDQKMQYETNSNACRNSCNFRNL